MPACTPNIGPRQQRRRLISGAVAFAVSIVLALALVAAAAPAALRALVFIPLLAAAIGFFQYREKT